MVKIFLSSLAAVVISMATLSAQTKNTATIDATKIDLKIDRLIYSQFSEHLGNCIYDGMWVGENSPIPNIKGVRTDVVDALKKIQVPSMRWPGGCFADEYHWMDGIGPKADRPKMINTNWGGVTEDNSFGTHEFMELCTQLNCEPYISGNLGSGTVQELSQWVEYTNSDNESPMTKLRKANGQEKSWGVKYWGVGNESWGCGGRMKPDYYSDLALHYSNFMRTYGSNRLKLIAVGPNGDDYNWTDVVMKESGTTFWGLSLHYYTWMTGASATQFNEDGWFEVMKKTSQMEEIVTKHSAIMDKYDPGKNVALVVDEWGTWYQVEPGTNPGFLFQQNSLRDALVAGINLNIFHNHADRVKMAAIAQVVNVLQSMILTKGEKMLLTPTYHVFDMYKVHQDAYLTPSTLECDNYTYGKESVSALSLSSSINKSGKMHISVCNLDANEAKTLTCNIKGYKSTKGSGQIITSKNLNEYNSFENPNALTLQPFSAFKINNNQLVIEMPPHSVVTIELDGALESNASAVKLNNPVQGLNYKLFDGAFRSVNELKNLVPAETGVTAKLAFPVGNGKKANDVGLTFNGFLKIENSGMYSFFLSSDDGSNLIIDNKSIILNDGFHGVVEREGIVYLDKGYHAIEVNFFQGGGGSFLGLEMQDLKNDKREVLTEKDFWREK
jgi:alpha-N-arabinofuranosidase